MAAFLFLYRTGPFLFFYILVAALFVSVCSCCNVGALGHPLVIAHRGGASLGPENSLLAVQRSIAVGAAAVEVDVRLTADSVPVVIHDASVDRTTNGSGSVASMSLDSIKALRLVDSDGAATTESVPSLVELLDFVDGRCSVLIEVKDAACSGVVEAVADAVEHCGAASWVAVQAFSDAVLERFRSLAVPFPLEKLFVFKFPLLPIIYDGSLCLFSMQKYSYVSSFNINRHFLCPGLVDYLRRCGKKVKAWTFGNSAGAVPASLCLDAVITDCP